MAKGEVLGICVICGKEIKSRWGAIQKDGLWVCAGRCSRTYKNEKKAWSLEKWDELRRRQAEYDRPVQAGEPSLEELPDKVKEVGAPKLETVAKVQRAFLVAGITVTVLSVLGLLLIRAC